MPICLAVDITKGQCHDTTRTITNSLTTDTILVVIHHVDIKSFISTMAYNLRSKTLIESWYILLKMMLNIPSFTHFPHLRQHVCQNTWTCVDQHRYDGLFYPDTWTLLIYANTYAKTHGPASTNIGMTGYFTRRTNGNIIVIQQVQIYWWTWDTRGLYM